MKQETEEEGSTSQEAAAPQRLPWPEALSPLPSHCPASRPPHLGWNPDLSRLGSRAVRGRISVRVGLWLFVSRIHLRFVAAWETGARACIWNLGGCRFTGPDLSWSITLHASDFLTLTFLGGTPDFLILNAWYLGTKWLIPVHPGVRKGLFNFLLTSGLRRPSSWSFIPAHGLYTVAVFLLKLYLCAVCSKSPVYKRVLLQERVCKSTVSVSPAKFPRYPASTINCMVLNCGRFIILFTKWYMKIKHRK